MKINRVVKILIFSDLVMLSAAELINPIFAVFVTQQIVGGDLKIVGFSATVYLLAKAFFQIIFGTWVDKKENEKYDFVILLLGAIIVSIVPLGFIFSSLPLHLYLLEAASGLGHAMTLSAWYAIFTRHIDRGREGFEWSLETTTVALGGALAASLGGIMADRYGFKFIFLIISAISLVGSFILIAIFRDLKTKKFSVSRKETEELIRPIKKRLFHKQIL